MTQTENDAANTQETKNDHEIEVVEKTYDSLQGEHVLWHEQFMKDLNIDGYI
jgi:hypothetical protein